MFLLSTLHRFRIIALLLLTLSFLPHTHTNQQLLAAPASPQTVTLEPIWLANDRYETTSTAWGDSDNDGWLDVFFGDDAGGIRMYRNQRGSLEPLPSWYVDVDDNDRVRDIALGDMNRDNWLDLVVVTFDGPILIYLNQQGHFPNHPSWRSPLLHHGWSLALGDMNGDGNLDVVVACYKNKAVMYYNQGDGTLGASPVWNSDIALPAVYVALDDVDGDHDLDAAFANYSGNAKTQVYHNLNGLLTANPVWQAPQIEASTSVVWRNIDHDTYPELFIASESHGNRFFDNISGTLALTPTWSSTNPDKTQDLIVEDIDGDYDLDVISVSGNTPQQPHGPMQIYLAQAGTYPETPDWTSNERDISYGLAAGDIDNDGDLDIIRSNNEDPNRLYLNGQAPFAAPQWALPVGISVRGMAWGDFDADNLLDLAIASYQGVQVYQNIGGSLSTTPIWQSSGQDNLFDIAWADMNMDGKLDLVTASRTGLAMFLNHGDGNFGPNGRPGWQDVRLGTDYASLAIGDVDNDGDLDMAVGRNQAPIYILGNRATEPPPIGQTQPFSVTMYDAWVAPVVQATRNLAWGDVDGDGDIDLAVANDGQPTQVYRNDGLRDPLALTPHYQFNLLWNNITYRDRTRDIAWADINSDGLQDLLVANYNQPNRVFLNQGETLDVRPIWSSRENDPSNGLEACDIEGDGDLDLLAFNEGTPSRLYLNEAGSLSRSALWSTPTAGRAFAGACGDADADGDHDLAIAYLSASGENQGTNPADTITTAIYQNQRFNLLHQGVIPQPLLEHPGGLAADGIANPTILSDPQLPISYSLRYAPARQVDLAFSRMGGGHWTAAIPLSGTLGEPNLGPNSYTWDLFRSGVRGSNDTMAVQLRMYPSVLPQAHSTAGSYRYGAYTTNSFPFRVRGTGVRVLHATAEQPPIAAAGAIVYRLGAGQSGGGRPMAASQGSAPFITDGQGYLQGQSELRPDDRLIALVPITTTYAYSLYHTNGVPTEMGLDGWTITTPGTQELIARPEHPLLLFNLKIALEWDASHSPTYLQKLESDLHRASRYLYDFTNGQVALGKISVYQNGEQLNYADVVIHATNRLRPFASEGGIVLTKTLDLEHPEVIYDIGQVHIGSHWNRNGIPGEDISTDWSVILAHELSHYLFFMEDTYLGIQADQLLVPVDTCAGSAMGDVYLPTNTEFVFDPEVWQAHCQETLAAQELKRTEWETLRLWYPALITPTMPLAGPQQMPFVFTNVQIVDPLTPTTPLVDPTLYLEYAGNTTSSAKARGFLITNQQTPALTDDTIMPLGSTVNNQNRILGRGAQPGDRFCLFDRGTQHFGCEVLSIDDQYITLKHDAAWKPLVTLSPVTSTTLKLQVTGIQPGLSLQARLFPDDGSAGSPVLLEHFGDGYRGSLVSQYPSMSGHIQVWVEEPASETNPRRETLIAYSIGGNPGYYRGGGGYYRGGGGYYRGGGGYYRLGGAPLLSPDGQMTFYTKATFEVGQFYAIQEMAELPALPAGVVNVGQGYQLVTAQQTQPISGSVSFQYLGYDLITANVEEPDLAIGFWNGTYWERLSTVLNTTYNVAAAHAPKPGIYTLIGGHSQPSVQSLTPTMITSGLTNTLLVSGNNLLAPATLHLQTLTSTISLSVTLHNSSSGSITLTAALAPGYYRTSLTNGDGSSVPAPALALYPPTPACFAETFNSQLGKWQIQGTWATSRLASGEVALDDSPGHAYAQAVAPNQYLTSTLTFHEPINLANCQHPVLSFEHDYVFARTAAGDDHGSVEVSTDNGLTWQIIADFTGGGAHGLRPATPSSDEWSTPHWKPVRISLRSFQNQTIRLRLRMTVDRDGSDRGWLLDNLMINQSQPIYLPLINR
ncbi:MAG: VCBS repeat-containing protein [Chloroflexi bacterium]|nr:VCBS repeat-containing protein [Chloroflexota bacterium]